MFSIGVSVCTHTRQVEHQRCSRTGRVQKNHKTLRKNTIFNEHPVPYVDIPKLYTYRHEELSKYAFIRKNESYLDSQKEKREER